MCYSNKIYTLEEIKEIAEPVFQQYPSITEAYLFGVFKKQVDTLNEEDAMKIMPSSIERDGIKIYEQGGLALAGSEKLRDV